MVLKIYKHNKTIVTTRFPFKITLSGLILLLLLCVPNQSCDDRFVFWVNCSECYVDPPSYDFITVSVKINNENPSIPITVYYGPFEDNKVAAIDTARKNKIKIWLPTDRHYTLKAEYYKNSRLYNVISGTYLKLRFEEESCSEPCYYVTGKEVDLILRF